MSYFDHWNGKISWFDPLLSFKFLKIPSAFPYPSAGVCYIWNMLETYNAQNYQKSQLQTDKITGGRGESNREKHFLYRVPSRYVPRNLPQYQQSDLHKSPF